MSDRASAGAPAGRTVVLVHGAFHGAWCWRFVVEGLESLGVRVVPLDLPGHGESAKPLGCLQEDAAEVRAAVDECEGPVVLCGHSYGGVVITEAAGEGCAVEHLVYVAAGVPDVGENLASVWDEDEKNRLLGATQFSERGELEFQRERAQEFFFHDCTEGMADWAVSQLGPQSPSSLEAQVSRAAWRELDSTYVVCSQDRVVSASAQQYLAKRCRRSVTWPTGHSAMLSEPARLVSLLSELAA